jgi:hypothetical protein
LTEGLIEMQKENEGFEPKSQSDDKIEKNMGKDGGEGGERAGVSAGVLALEVVVPLGLETIVKAAGGKAFGSFETDFRMEVLRERDKLLPEEAAGLRGQGTLAKAIRSNTHVTKDVESHGMIREFNLTRAETEVFEHYWYNPRHQNTASGTYRAKAALALTAEATQFDTAFYRMQRRDPENVQGYLVSFLDKGGSTYGSFLQEALSHMVFQRVVRRNLLDKGYGDGISSEYDVLSEEQALDDDINETWADFGIEEVRGIWVNRDEDRVKVNAVPPMGILPPDPTVVGAPGGDDAVAEVSFIPADEVMEGMVTGGLGRRNEGVFVSRAKQAETLAQDILALYAGTRQEFGIYPREVTMVLATMRATDFDAIVTSWGLRRTRVADLRLLAHWLSFHRGYRNEEPTFVTTKADWLRCRDYMALANTAVGIGTTWQRVHNLEEKERTVGLPYATWQTRMCVVYNVLEFVGEQWSVIRPWDQMRHLALVRGVDLGALIDYACQVTVGSLRNLRRFPAMMAVAAPALLALARATNVCFSETEQVLCYKYEWLDGGAPGDLPIDRSGIVSSKGYSGVENTKLGADADAWWVETRCTWEAVQSPDLEYPIVTHFQEARRAGVKRFGSQVIYSYETTREQMNRYLSLLRAGDDVQFAYTGVAGRVSQRIRWTNDAVSNHFVHWSHNLDFVVKGSWTGGSIEQMEMRACDVFVGYGSDPTAGDYAGLGEFAGFEDF